MVNENASYPTQAQRAADNPVSGKVIEYSPDPLWARVQMVDKRFERALARKKPWEAIYQECYDYALPMKEGVFESAPGEERIEFIYDETAVVGVQEFASSLQNGLCPDGMKWTHLRAGSAVPLEERNSVNAALESVTDAVFEEINASNFAMEIVEAFFDLAVGTASIAVNEGDYSAAIQNNTIPISQLVIDKGPDDRIDMNGRQRKIEISHIGLTWPRGQLTGELPKMLADNPAQEVLVREATYRDWSEDIATYRYVVWAPKQKAVIFEETYRGEGSNPIITFRWTKLAGEVWGRGVLFNALPAIRTCNLTVQLILENAEMALGGMYQADDDGVVNPDNITVEPGTIVTIAPGSQGIRPIESAADFNVSQLVLGDMRQNIKRALYNEMLGDPNRSPKSATEVATRMSHLARQIGSSYGRLRSELIEPYLQRVIYLLRKRGIIELPTLNRRVIQPVPANPFAMAQKLEEVQDIDRFLALVQGRFGPEVMNLYVNGEAIVPMIAEKMRIPGRVIRSPQERAQFVQQAAQLMGGMNGGQGQGGNSEGRR